MGHQSGEVLDYSDVKVAEQIYESARPSDGPYNAANPLTIKRREPYHLVLQDRKLLDFDGQVLCDNAGDDSIKRRIKTVMEEVGDMETFKPNFTHPEIDLAQTRIAQLLDETYGGGPWAVSFRSSGTRANEESIGYAGAALEGDAHLVLNREGYHGAGLMRALIGQSGWRSRATLPLGVPVTHLEFRDSPDGRDYFDDFERFAECTLGTDGKPFYITEGGVGGVMGFRNINPLGIQASSMLSHKKGGGVQFDNVQVMPFRTGDNFLSVDGLVDPNEPLTIPDVVTSAKGNGVGYPFAFVAARKAFLDRAKGHLGKDYDTYGRNLRGITAFNALYEMIKRNGFVPDLKRRIARWEEGLRTIAQAHSDKVREVTGKGFMSGLELDSAQRVQNFAKTGLEKTMIAVNTGSIRGDVLRLGIKLDSPDEIINEGLQKIEDTLKLS